MAADIPESKTPKGIRGVGAFDPTNDPGQSPKNGGSKTPPRDQKLDAKRPFWRIVLTIVLLAVVVICTTWAITGSSQRSPGKNSRSEQLDRVNQEISALEQQEARMRKERADPRSIERVEVALRIAREKRARIANETEPTRRSQNGLVAVVLDTLCILALFGLWAKRTSSSERSEKIKGIARNVVNRTEQTGMNNQKTLQVCTFRVEILGSDSSALIPVELRGERYQGPLNDGDSVELPGPWRRGETLQLKRVLNLTTGAWVEMGDSPWHGVRILYGVLFFIFFVLVLVFMLKMASHGP